jgi:putative oxidoreductase
VSNADVLDFALLIARVWLGIVIFVHGASYLARTVRNDGMATHFDDVGLHPGPVHAWTVTLGMLIAGELLVAGLVTPFAYGGLCAVMLVALVTEHRHNGFFVSAPGQGWEYVTTIAVLSIALGTVGPGHWSLDDAVGLNFPFDPGKALLVTAVVGIAGAAAYLALFYRPQKAKPRAKTQPQPHAKAA